MPREKCTAKRRIWERIIWEKRGANNMESKRTEHRGRIQRRRRRKRRKHIQ